MRPDKKKTRHHDSRKREAMAKSKNGGGKDKDKKVDETARETKPPAEEPGPDRYDRRKVESNWTKYELPSSSDDEDGEEMTGQDFNYVIQHANTSDSQFRLKAEREWDSEELFSVGNELFALDAKALEEALDAVPFYRQIGLERADIGDDLARFYDDKASRNSKDGVGTKTADATSVNEEVLRRLKETVISSSSSSTKTESAATTTSSSSGGAPPPGFEAMKKSPADTKDDVKDETVRKDKSEGDDDADDDDDDDLEEWLEGVLDS